MKKSLLYTTFLLVISTSLVAQFKPIERKEFPTKRFNTEEFRLVSLKEKGLMLIRIDKPWQYNKQKEFQFIFLDTNFHEIKKHSHLLDYKFISNRKEYFDENKYFYYYSQSDKISKFSLFRLNIFTNKSELFEGKLPVKFEVDRITALNDEIYFLGSYKGRPIVIKYNINVRVPKVVPSFYGQDEEIQNFYPDLEHNKVYFIIENTTQKDCRLSIQSYSSLIGATERTFIKNDKKDITAKFATLYTIDNKQKIALGLYTDKCQSTPQGLYVSNILDKNTQKVKYYAFSDLANFFGHLKPKKVEKMKEAVINKAKKGKPYKNREKFYPQIKLIETENEIIFILEKYNTSYQNNSNPNYPYPTSPRARASTVNRSVFYPIGGVNNDNKKRFSYALFFAINKKGRKTWDNVIKIEDVEQRGFSNIIQLGFRKDSIITAYFHKDDEEIYSKMTRRYTTIKEETKQEITEMCKPYNVSESLTNDFIHWYGDKFLLYGLQRSKDKVQVESSAFDGKKLFHLTKLDYKLIKEEETEKEKKKKEKEELKEEKRKRKK